MSFNHKRALLFFRLTSLRDPRRERRIHSGSGAILVAAHATSDPSLRFTGRQVEVAGLLHHDAYR